MNVLKLASFLENVRNKSSRVFMCFVLVKENEGYNGQEKDWEAKRQLKQECKK